jgi:hypothetical protein
LDCFKEIEREFDQVRRFLKNEQNRDATVETVSKCTDVSIKRITHFIRDGRIYGEDFPNLGYPCAYCGKLIKKQFLCNSCFEDLSFDIAQSIRKEELNGNQQIPFKESQYWRVKQEK